MRNATAKAHFWRLGVTGGTEYLHNEDSPNTPRCAGGEAAFLLFQFQLFFALAFQWVFCFLLLMEHTFCLIFFCFCYTRDKSEFIFVRFFLECGFCFFFFFCNFLGRDEPFNVFNCCNDLLHQVILLVFF